MWYFLVPGAKLSDILGGVYREVYRAHRTKSIKGKENNIPFSGKFYF